MSKMNDISRLITLSFIAQQTEQQSQGTLAAPHSSPTSPSQTPATSSIMALRPTNIKPIAPMIPIPSIPTLPKSFQSYPTSTQTANLALPKIGLPPLPPIQIPTNAQLADSIQNLRNQTQNRTINNIQNQNNTSEDNECLSTISSNADYSDYDIEDDTDTFHKYKRKNKHKSPPKSKRKYRRHTSPQKRIPEKDSNTNNKKAPNRKGQFKCTKCRRAFGTNRALASHQRAHKNKIPPRNNPTLSAPQTHTHTHTPLQPLINAYIPANIGYNNEETVSEGEDNDIAMNNIPNIPTLPNIPFNHIMTPTMPAMPKIFCDNFKPNLSNKNASLRQLKSLKIAMPVIKGRKKYQINSQNISPYLNSEDYRFHCNKCNAAFFYQSDVIKHKQYSECAERPYLCPFCERPFKSCLSVKKHCVNLHSGIINWELVGELLNFVRKHEQLSMHSGEEVNYTKTVRKFARDFFLWKQINDAKTKGEEP